MSADSTGPLGAGAASGERSRGGLGGFRSLQAKGHGSPRGQRVAAGGLCGSEDWPRALCAWPTGHGPVWGPPDPFWLRGSEASCGSETTLVGGNGATRAGTRGPCGNGQSAAACRAVSCVGSEACASASAGPWGPHSPRLGDQEALPAANQAQGSARPGSLRAPRTGPAMGSQPRSAFSGVSPERG